MDSEKLEKLRDLQLLESNCKSKIADAKKIFEESIKITTDCLNSHQSQIAALKEKITEEALKEFEKTGSKKLLGGIGIQVKNTISYDNELAFNYCKDKGLCLKFDDKSFDKIAVPLGLDFVTTGTKNTVTFPAEIKL